MSELDPWNLTPVEFQSIIESQMPQDFLTPDLRLMVADQIGE
jgi:hypothetical protein